jgi:type IV pilus assembly protein PilW
MTPNRAPRRESGLTLIELMVAMTLGMILTLAIGQIFTSSRFTHVSTNENARMQENARFALQMIERELRMAGFYRNGSTGTFPTVVSGVNGPAFVATDGSGVNNSDEFTVRFFGSDNPAGTAADNTVINCIGEAARLNEAVLDRFYIAANASGEPSLYCASVRPSDTAVTTTTELLNGIESMQLLLGEDTNSDKTADRYLGIGDAALNITNVVSVKVSLLLRSSVEVMEVADNRKFNHFSTSYSPADVPPGIDPGAVFNSAGANLDKRMRRLFPTIVALRNRIN